MPIISSIGRRHPRVRALIYTIHGLLILGSLSMVYPFLLMLAGSTKSAVDAKEFAAVPEYLFRDRALYRKHIEGLFNESLDAMTIAFHRDVASFEDLEPPPLVNSALVAGWREFVQGGSVPDYACGLGYVSTVMSRTVPQKLREFKQELMQRFADDIDELNRAFGTEFVGWNGLFLVPEDSLQRRNRPPTGAFAEAYRQFKARQPLACRYWFSVDGFYQRLFLKPQYTKDIHEYNRTHGTAYASYDEIRLTRHCPGTGTPKEREDWEQFVRTTLNLLWVRVEAPAQPQYQEFLRTKYGSIAELNRRYATSYAAFAEVPLVAEPPGSGQILTDWESFISGWIDPQSGRLHIVPVEHLRIHSVDFLFRDHLERTYGSVEALNAALGTRYAAFLDVQPPQELFHYQAFTENVKGLRREFTTRNYRAVLDYLLFHGRGIVNTVIYCGLAILLALVVNPLAAYAMSRYRMPSTYKVLLFLLLTMAFPPMVTQIPVFLMLRQLGLLNTFAALLLPGLANGYSIFLLKGFFDSLPRELYESAQIDGAGEWVMFWHITMALSTPILAVIALNTFTMAYSNFMFALLLCQDESMWTLMVWLYQLQTRSGQGVVYASLIVAGLPTLLVFIFCQKIIMRGIVVPVEK